MSILATVYETGTVEGVDMADLMRLFGAEPEEGVDTRFSFTDDGWVEAYLDFKKDTGEIAFDENIPEEGDLSPTRKIH